MTTATGWIHKYLQRLSDVKAPDNSVEQFLLAHGRYYSSPKPWVPGCGWRPGKPGDCYYNAWKLALKDPGRFVYCEGYVASANVVPHGWVLDRNDGSVIDRSLPVPKLPPGLSQYFGVSFTFEFAVTSMLKPRRELHPVFDEENHDLIKRLQHDPEFRRGALVVTE